MKRPPFDSLLARAGSLGLLLWSAAPACAPSRFDELAQYEVEHDPCADAAPGEREAAGCRAHPADGGGGDAASEEAGSASPDAAGMQDAGEAGPEDASQVEAGTCDACVPDASATRPCPGQAPICVPDAEESEMQACGACDTGVQERTRICAADGCSWEPWSDWSACAGVTAACKPGDTKACSPADACGQRVCSDACTWGDCVPKQPGGCLLRRNGTQEEGSNFRCCAEGKWQFCLPNTCQWSSDCRECSPQFCEC